MFTQFNRSAISYGLGKYKSALVLRIADLLCLEDVIINLLCANSRLFFKSLIIFRFSNLSPAS